MKPQKFLKESDTRHLTSELSELRAPDNDKRVVQLCKPFAVLSKSTYSAPVTLPLGLAYLGGVLDKAGYQTRIIDATLDTKQVSIRRSDDNLYNIQGLNAEDIIKQIDPNTIIFAVSLMFSQDWVHHREFIKKVKKSLPHLIIVVGGEHPTAIPEYVLRDCPEIDYVISGEGELSMLEFVHAIFKNQKPYKVKGLSFVNDSNEFVDNGLSRRIEFIDEIPRPAWHLLKVENYFNDYFTSGLAKGRNIPILGTRGCPYQCTFCSSPSMWTTRYVMRDVKDLVDEMEWLIEEFGANSFEFFDLTAIIRKEWIMSFCNEIKTRKLNNITWQLPVGTRTEALDEETLQAIYDTGCCFIAYAPESGSEKTLKIIKKKVKLDRFAKSIKTAIKIGHTIRINIIIGFPHETLWDILKTLIFSFRAAIMYGVSDINFAIYAPYPGSELFKKLIDEKKITLNDDYFNRLIAQFDFTKLFSVCDRVSAAPLMILRFIGFSISYLLIYLSRPKRIFSLIRNLTRKKFVANNMIEQRVFDIYMRHKLKSKSQKI